MKNTELKTKIRHHLSAVGEATAKQIIQSIGHSDYPTEVISALSEMRTDAEVECEKRKGKGNEYWYWLTKVSADVVVADRVVDLSAGIEVSELRKQLALTERQCDDHFKRAEHHERRLNDLSGDLLRFFVSVKQITGSNTKPASLSECETQIAAAVAMLRSQIDEIIEVASDVVDVKQAAVGYIVRVTGKKPRICTKPENAHAAAMTSARQHGRADVLALVPVGKAVRCAEWMDAA